MSTPSAAVTVDALAHFAIAAPPSATAGTSFTVTVTAEDSSNNTIVGYVGTVHFASSDPAAPVVPADYTFVAADNGTHTFTNGVTFKTAPSQSITVNDTSDATKTGTASVVVTPGAAAQVGFTQQPSGGTGGVAWTTQPKVAIQDALGNTVTTSTASVTLAITSGTGTSGAVLTCTTNPKAAVSGVATFAGCKIDKAGTGYTLTATAAGLTSAVSNAFDVALGPAAKVVYTQQPTAVVAGSLISPAVVVTVQDAGGNTVTSSSATVTIAIGTNPGGGTLSGTVSVAASGGVATFADLSINKTGTGYTLVASSSGLTSATSSTFNVTAGAAVKLGFTQQPSGGTGGVAWTTQPKVAIQDALGNTVTTSTASVTLAITGGTGTSGAVLTCTANPKAAVVGRRHLRRLQDRQGRHRLHAHRHRHRPDQRRQQRLRRRGGAGHEGRLHAAADGGGRGFGDQPRGRGDGAGRGWEHGHVEQRDGDDRDQHEPRWRDAVGDRVDGATSGVATFADLSIDKSGNGYKLTASSAGLTSATSGTFNVTAGAAVQLGFTQQPGGGTGGVAWTTQPKVAIQDALGNTVTTSTASVTLAITTATGTPGAVLTCTTNPKAAVSGIATFAGCKIDKPGTGYTLTATATGLTNATSNPFDVVVGPATKVVYTQPPTAVVAGSVISPAVVVTVQDAGGNTVTSSSATVTIAIGTNPGGGTLSGTVSVAASSGVATFADLSINKTGTGYTLVASSTGLTSATSSTFNVTAGAAVQLGFTQQPSGGTGGVAWSTQPKVAIQDALGNTVTTSSASVTLAITSGTGNPGRRC